MKTISIFRITATTVSQFTSSSILFSTDYSHFQSTTVKMVEIITQAISRVLNGSFFTYGAMQNISFSRSFNMQCHCELSYRWSVNNNCLQCKMRKCLFFFLCPPLWPAAGPRSRAWPSRCRYPVGSCERLASERTLWESCGIPTGHPGWENHQRQKIRFLWSGSHDWILHSSVTGSTPACSNY